MEFFGIKDAFDILIVAMVLYYLYRLMKDSGVINIFYGVMAFIVVWVIASQMLAMRLTGTILDKFMNIGLLVLVILFQDQLKRFLVDLGSKRRWRFLRNLFQHNATSEEGVSQQWIMSIVRSCMNLSKSKTGALIVIQQDVPLENYENTGDAIDASVNSRLIENIFFKNSPLHDGAMIIAGGRIKAVGCILPVSHDRSIPRSLGLRHRSALGISQATDAIAIVVSEETGTISIAYKGDLRMRLSTTDLEQRLSQLTSK
ncbi:MAG: diadenylate cyclase CdaA [Muribaculaceae bacterium]|nr:diadenylate cyclase CdaA [Muribaculaceae bacterium]